jgi:vitamin B12 transporter
MMRYLSAALSGAIFTSITLPPCTGAQAEATGSQSSALPPVVVKQASPKPKKQRSLRNKKHEPDRAASTPPLEGEGSGQVAISPSLTPTPLSQVGSSVTVITAKDLEQKQIRTAPDALRDVPGLNVVQTGGPGGLTAVFIRGTDANHTKVLLDGIDIGDPTTADGSANLAHLLTSGINRIEVLRGPQSGLYGSDAIGGVIDIRTKPGSGPTTVTGSVEAGSFATFNQTAGVSGSSGPFSYSFNAAHLHSGDVPVTPGSFLPPSTARNDDSYDNRTYAARVGLEINKNLDMGVTTHYAESVLNFTSSNFNEQAESNSRQLFTRAFAHQTLFDGALEQTFGVGYADFHRQEVDLDWGTSLYIGDRLKYDWTGTVKLVPTEILTLGAEHQTDEVTSSTPAAQVSNSAGFAQLQSSIGERFFNIASIRYDDNSKFGDVTTYRIAPAFLILETGTKLKASYGTGFKAPSLFQLYAPYFGNPNLAPEKSSGYDAGFEQTLFAKRVQFGATYFHNDVTNLIEWDSVNYTYFNVGRAKIDGVETFLAVKPRSDMTLRAGYTYTMAMNAELNEELLRRPKHKVSLGATWQATQALSLSATLIHIGDFTDASRDYSIQYMLAPGHTVVNVAGSYDLGGGLTAFARIDNLFNESYQDPTGFLRPGVGAFAGMKVSLNASELAPERN